MTPCKHHWHIISQRIDEHARVTNEECCHCGEWQTKHEPVLRAAGVSEAEITAAMEEG